MGRFPFKKISCLLGIAISLSLPLRAESPKPLGYTLIGDLTQNLGNGLSCDFAAALSLDKTEIRVIRLDPRKGTYNINYFAKSTRLFKDYGVRIDLAHEFDIPGVDTATVDWDMEKGHRDLVVKVFFHDSESGQEESKERRFSLERFFQDSPKKCLK